MASTTIDLLPPYGEPEVTTSGRHADEYAWAALILVALVVYSRLQ